MEFRDKWAIVTGASSGIGKAFAEKLAEAGAKLVLVARNEDALKKLAIALKQAYDTESIIVLKDLSKPSAAKEVFGEVKKLGITVDVLVNSAGFGNYGHLHTQDLDFNQQMLMVNILALTELTHLFLPDMVAKKAGIVINMSSLVAFVPLVNLAVYAASKAYVQYFSETLWAEYKEEGVQFLAVCPGSTDTNFFKVAKMKSTQSIVANPKLIVDQALKALEKNKIYVICGPFKNKILGQVPKLFTKKFITKLTDFMRRKKLT